MKQRAVSYFIGLVLIFCGISFGKTIAECKKDYDYVKAGEFKKIYDPSIGEPNQWYINDHCFIRDANGICICSASPTKSQ
jgi:hypothetical protein